GLGCVEGTPDSVQVVSVTHSHDVPTVGLEAPRNVLRKTERGIAVNGDMIVVVEQIELAKAKMAREGSCFTGDTFHQVAIAHESPGPVIDDRVSRAVEVIGQHPFSDGHPNGVAKALAQ